MLLGLPENLEDINVRLESDIEVYDLVRRVDLSYFHAHSMSSLSRMIFVILCVINYIGFIIGFTPNYIFNTQTVLLESIPVVVGFGNTILWKWYWERKKEMYSDLKCLIYNYSPVRKVDSRVIAELIED